MKSWAQDGLRGLDLARTGRYELVVLDLLLPGLDGVTVLRRLIDKRDSSACWSCPPCRT